MQAAAPDNANPVVHATAGSTARRLRRPIDDLDLSDDDEWAKLGRNADEYEDLDASRADEIDAEEIFGKLRFCAGTDDGVESGSSCSQ